MTTPLHDALKGLGYYPAGAPFGEALQVGDYGPLIDGELRHNGNLQRKFGVNQEDWHSKLQKFAFAQRSIRHSGVLLKQGDFQLKATDAVGANASLQFSQVGSCLFGTGKTAELWRRDPDDIARQVWDQRSRGLSGFFWRRNNCIVWEAIYSKDAFCIESRKPNAQLNLQLDADASALNLDGIPGELVESISLKAKAAAERQSNDFLVSSQNGTRGAIGMKLIRIAAFGQSVIHRGGMPSPLDNPRKTPLEPGVPDLEHWETPFSFESEVCIIETVDP